MATNGSSAKKNGRATKLSARADRSVSERIRRAASPRAFVRPEGARKLAGASSPWKASPPPLSLSGRPDGGRRSLEHFVLVEVNSVRTNRPHAPLNQLSSMAVLLRRMVTGGAKISHLPSLIEVRTLSASAARPC